jgi:hypothetical protein
MMADPERPEEGHDSDHRDRRRRGRRSLGLPLAGGLAQPGGGCSAALRTWTAGMTEIRAAASPFATAASVQTALVYRARATCRMAYQWRWTRLLGRVAMCSRIQL